MNDIQNETKVKLITQEKLDIVDRYISDGLQAAAKAYHVNDAVMIARVTAELADFEMSVNP